jgi:hypothetical protein
LQKMAPFYRIKEDLRRSAWSRCNMTRMTLVG